MKEGTYKRIALAEPNIKVYEGKNRQNQKRFAVEYGVYVVDEITKKRKRKNKTTGFKFLTSNEAKAYATRQMNGNPLANEKASKKSKDTTIEELIKAYDEHISSLPIEQMTPGTKKEYHDKLKTLVKYSKDKGFNILDLQLKSLTNDEITLWLNHLKNGVITRKGINMASRYYSKHKEKIKAMLIWAKDNNYFYMSTDRYEKIIYTIVNDVNPTIPTKAIKEAKKKRVLNEEEFAQLIKPLEDMSFNGYTIDGEPSIFFQTYNGKLNIEYKYLILFSILMYTGVRCEEAVCLTIDDIMFNEGKAGRIRINKAVSRHRKEDEEVYYQNLLTKNEESIRYIPMRPELRQLLLDYVEQYNKYNCRERFEGVLLPGAEGKYISENAIWNKLKNLKIKTGITKPFSKHDFRRSCATILLTKYKLSYADILSFFGWESEKMLKEVYDGTDDIQHAELVETRLEEVGFFDSEGYVQAKRRGMEHMYLDHQKQRPE